MFNANPQNWAESLFGEADLNDPRRTKRLVKLAGDLAAQTGHSVVRASQDPASIEGAYRFIRNQEIAPENIAVAGFKQTDKLVRQRALVLAIQDTTGLSYRHSVCDELGEVNSAKVGSTSSRGRTLYVHSTLMIDAHSEQILGLSNQHYFFRKQKHKEKKEPLQRRSIEEKESFKWQRNSEEIASRMGSLDNILDVCDREADIYEYLDYQLNQGHRFLVRARDNRQLKQPEGKLADIVDNIEPQSHFTLDIKQKGGRKARQAKIALSYTPVLMNKPTRATGQKEIAVNMIVCQEVGSDDVQEKLCWILYTTEAINGVEEARSMVRYYELRWRIEEFHKVWKSDGAQVEKLRMQSRENLKRIAIIQAFIAVRLLQLQALAQNKESSKSTPCTTHFSELSWKVLWKKTERQKPIPSSAPSLYWAYYAMAKLGGWYDSKRTGRVGVKALWSGWLTLMNLVESFETIKELDINDNL
jgi:hypothetical protein